MNTATENKKLTGKVLALGLLLATLVVTLLSATPAHATMTTDEAFARGHNASGQPGHDGSERKQRLNLVQCPTVGSSFLCVGTGAGDVLIGMDGTYDFMQGGEGDDTYDGKGGCDLLQDTSLTSSDHYMVSDREFCNVGISVLEIQDSGGNKDTLDLSGFYSSSDFVFEGNVPGLYMDGPGVNDIIIDDFFATGSSTVNSIDTFRFSDKTLTARQVRAMSA